MIDIKNIVFTPLGINVNEVLLKYPEASYVGQAPLRTKDGFSDQAGDIFYTPTPDTSKGHTNYFGVFVRNYKAYITNAIHVKNLHFRFVEMPDGKFIYSRFQHDFRTFGDGCFVDGGWWMPVDSEDFAMMGRTSVTEDYKMFMAKIVDGKFVKCYNY